MIDLQYASKRQLITIALYENCNLDLKYNAARELQLRMWRDYMLTDLVRLNARNKSVFDISIELGISQYMVRKKSNEYGLRRSS